jgi:hypothetical protein
VSGYSFDITAPGESEKRAPQPHGRRGRLTLGAVTGRTRPRISPKVAQWLRERLIGGLENERITHERKRCRAPRRRTATVRDGREPALVEALRVAAGAQLTDWSPRPPPWSAPSPAVATPRRRSHTAIWITAASRDLHGAHAITVLARLGERLSSWQTRVIETIADGSRVFARNV